MVRMTATEASRNFSELLNRVAAGEQIEIVRNGRPVAMMAPAMPAPMSPEAFRALMDSLPPLDEQFAQDVRDIRASIPPLEDPWRS